MFAVVVSLTLKPCRAEAFLPLMHTNARTSLSRETGCRQFDVATDPARPEEVVLYEVYDTRLAFDAHLATEHFKQFDNATAQMIAHKDVRTFSQVFQ